MVYRRFDRTANKVFNVFRIFVFRLSKLQPNYLGQIVMLDQNSFLDILLLRLKCFRHFAFRSKGLEPKIVSTPDI
jgi:hypothetical protein